MDGFIHSTVKVFQQELIGKCEVYNTLRDMIDIVESYNLETKYLQAQKKFQVAEQLNQMLISRIQYLESENSRTERELQQIKSFGKTVREKFLSDILFFLSENRTNQRLKERIMELESMIPEGGLDLTRIDGPKENQVRDSTEKVIPHPSEQAQQQQKQEIIEETADDKDVPRQIAVEIPSQNNTTEEPTAVTAQATVIPSRNPIYPPLILDLEEKLMLTMFAFLTTGEVLEFAQVCRYIYQRVDQIFGINYPLIKPEWRIRELVVIASSAELAGTRRPEPLLISDDSTSTTSVATTLTPTAATVSSATSSGAANTTLTFSYLMSSVLASTTTAVAAATPTVTSGVTTVKDNSTIAIANATSAAVAGESTANSDFRITRELIEPITKKLTVPEIKVIVGLAEKVKKFQLQVEALNTEKEDLVEEKERINAQLFFFMNKLQECEAVLMEFMQKERTLRQQAASDNEVISYLDLQVQQLDGDLVEVKQRAGALQASLDLQMGTHSVREEQLQGELNEYKQKYEQLEAKFKTERKLLAKEVKILRSKVETLTVEKTQMSSKLTALRQALSIDVPVLTGNASNHSSVQHSPVPPAQQPPPSHHHHNGHHHGNHGHHHNSNHPHHNHHHHLPGYNELHKSTVSPLAAASLLSTGNEPDLSDLMAMSRQQSQGAHQSNNSKTRKRGGSGDSEGVNQFW